MAYCIWSHSRTGTATRFLRSAVNIMNADFCIEALKEALAKHGTPEIYNTDQDSQFTSAAGSTCRPMQWSRSVWMAKGAWRDKGMIERFWPSLKYEYVYLNAFDTGSTAWANGPKRGRSNCIGGHFRLWEK